MTPGDPITLTNGERVTYIRDSHGGVRVRNASGGERTVSLERIRGERVAPPAPARVERLERDADRHVAAMQAVAVRVPEAPLVRASELRAIPKRKPLRSAAYLAYVRKHPCCTPGCKTPDDRVEAHHYGEHGTATKTDDYRTVPLCHGCHYDEFHQHGALAGCTRAETDEIFLRSQSDLLTAWERTRAGDGAASHAELHGRIVNALVEGIREESAHG